MNDERDLEEVYEEWIESLDRKIAKSDSPSRRARFRVVRAEVLRGLNNIRKYGTPEGDYNVPIGANIKM